MTDHVKPFVENEGGAHSAPKNSNESNHSSTVNTSPVICAGIDMNADVDAIVSVAVDTVVKVNGFASLDLAPEILMALEELQFTNPTAVQAQVVPLAIGKIVEGGGRSFVDLMVSSETGSGKTAAFLLPVIQGMLEQAKIDQQKEKENFDRETVTALARGESLPKKAKRKNPNDMRGFKAPSPYALIMCPTRELAQQVAQDAINLLKHCRGLRVASVVGGVPYQVQTARLQNANLVVATPGRLLDLQRSMQIKLNQVRNLVLDEADRLLDLGFADDLAEIDALTKTRNQTMMFSATFGARVQQLAARIMNKPRHIETATPQEKHANIHQALYWSDHASHKRQLLDHLLRDSTINQAVVFASTQIECDGLASDLQESGFSAMALHGALSQSLRNRRLSMLRDGRIKFLVATDVAARGIDVPNISHVFNFGLPMKVEDYTHRIGRTGRAGRSGKAITLAHVADRRKIFDIEDFTKQPFNIETIAGLEINTRNPSRGDRKEHRGSGDGDRFKRGFSGKGGRPSGSAGRVGDHRFDGGGRFAKRPSSAEGSGFRQPDWVAPSGNREGGSHAGSHEFGGAGRRDGKFAKTFSSERRSFGESTGRGQYRGDGPKPQRQSAGGFGSGQKRQKSGREYSPH